MESLSPGLVNFTHAQLLLLQLLLPNAFWQRKLVRWHLDIYHWKPADRSEVVRFNYKIKVGAQNVKVRLRTECNLHSKTHLSFLQQLSTSLTSKSLPSR